VLGATREEIAAEKLAVAGPNATVVLPDDEFAGLVPGRRIAVGGAREAAAAFLRRDPAAVVLDDAALPGRLELREGEVRDGAHTREAAEWLLARLPDAGTYVVVASILADKDAAGILERLAPAGRTLVATRSTNPRALPAEEVAALGARWFERVETQPDPRAAVARGRELGPRVLVTGSLYLLADLSQDE
jgi:folylpolyglutamate synthase/dihydropteroate synthase